MRYVATTPAIHDINVSYEAPDTDEDASVTDKWKKWVFSIGFDVELDGEKYEKEYNFDTSISARKVTEKWKFTSYLSFDYSEDQYEYEDEIVKDIRRTWYAHSRLARKMGDHWALGIRGDLDSDIRYNNELSLKLSPEIEFNLFNYSEFSKKQFPIRMGLGINHHDYYEETIYNKRSEFVSNLHMSAASVIQGKWGNIINVIEGAFYIHDFRKNNFEWVNIFDFRLFKGFSINALFVVNLIHDQLYLEKGNLTLEEVLLHRKELETMQLSKMYPVVIKSRDGLDLVSYLTLPSWKDKNGRPGEPLPMVLFVHGGPWGRDTWGYDPYHRPPLD